MAAAERLARSVADTGAKNKALQAMADAIEQSAATLLRENARDVEAAKTKGLDAASIDRLTLTSKTIASMADGLRRRPGWQALEKVRSWLQD